MYGINVSYIAQPQAAGSLQLLSGGVKRGVGSMQRSQPSPPSFPPFLLQRAHHSIPG